MSATTDGALLSGKERERYVTALFNRIAGPYDRLNRIISMGRDRAWRRAVLAAVDLSPGATAADLGCGTGDFYLLLREKVGAGGRVVGIDLSPGMLDLARKKAEVADPLAPADLRVGSAEATGLADASVDLVTMGWVLRNVGDRAATYREILRILKPGGTFLALDMSRPDFLPLALGSALYMRMVMPLVVAVLGGDLEAYKYLAGSTARFPKQAALADEWRAAGFRDVRTRSFMLGNIAAHFGKKGAAASEGRSR